MANHWHIKWLREGVKAWNQRRKKVQFIPDLTGVRFFDLLPMDFRDKPKTSRFFERINLAEADIEGGDLSGLNFTGANFTAANLIGANLSLTNFRGAKFSGAKLERVTAENSFFVGSDFSNAALEFSSIRGSDFRSARLIEVGKSREDFQINGNITDGAVFTQAELVRSSIQSISSALSGSKQRERKPEFNQFDVMYATNREAVFERGELVDFSASRATNLSYGICEVVVPKGHRIGSIGSPLWKRIFTGDDRLRTKRLIGLNQSLFWQYWRQSSERMKVSARPTLFVHGFNTSFSDAVIRAAQIGHDLKLGQGIGLFSWPSQGTKGGYVADINAVDASKFFLADFLEDFVNNHGELGINVVAHSMGCRLTALALEILLNRGSAALPKIENLVFAAADVDTGYMKAVVGGIVRQVSRTTNYASETDQALKIAAFLGAGSKVGLAPPAFIFSGLDTILVNDTDQGSFLHGYIGTSRTVIADLYHLLLNNLPPSRRHGLLLEPSPSGILWRITG